MFDSKKKNRILLIVIVAILMISMVVYYREKFTVFFEQPEKFGWLFLEASQITQVSWKLILTGVFISLIAVLIDLIVQGWDKSGLKRLIINPSGSAKIDLWSYFLSVFKIYEVLYFIFTLGIFYFFASIFLKFIDFKLANYISSPYLQFTFVFIITDFKHYIGHRFMHIKPFWELHAYHHSAEEFNLLTTTRGHLVEAGIYYVFTGFFFAIIGVPLISIFWVYAFREMYQYILHADVNWKLGLVGKYILISPAAHKLHHSIDEKHYNKNYSTFFIWWDLIFRTYQAPNEEYKIGITDNPYNKVGFLEGQWIGFKRFLKL